MSEESKKLNLGADAIISNLTSTAILGILNTSIVVSFATLIFAGTCPEYFASGVAFFLLAGSIGSILLALFSSYEGTIGCLQDVPSAISGLMAVSLAGMLAGSSQETIFANIFTVILLATLMTGIAFVLLGYFKLGNLVRFIPYPVMGGFLAGTGWILVKAGLDVSTGVSFNLSQVLTFFSQVNIGQLACGVLFGVWFFILSRYFSSNLLMAASVVISIVIFFIVAGVLDISAAQLEKQGWLLGPLPKGSLWRSLTIPDFSLIKWTLLGSQVGSILTIVLLSAISFLLGASALELIANRDLDMNGDLQKTGITNMIASLFGAPASYLVFSDTALATQMGARTRLAGILMGLFIAAIFFLGGQILSYVPKFVAGGMILFIGLSLLAEWLVDARKSFPLIDYLIVISILMIIEFIGFLEGVGAGIFASVIIFVIRYSSINLVKNAGDGNRFRSSKDRPIPDQRLLDHYGHQSLILQLQGFIFFGTANSLYETIRSYVDSTETPLQFIMLDLALVRGIDSSAVKSFEKIMQLLSKNDIHLFLANLSERTRNQLEAGGFSSDAHERLNFFSDLDQSLEHCEDNIVAAKMGADQAELQDVRQVKDDLMQAVYNDVMAALDHQVRYEELVERMRPYLEEIKVAAGECLFKQRDTNRNLFFIMRGTVNLVGESRQGTTTRIRTLGPWTVTGEVGSFSGYHAPYSAIVEKEGLIYRLGEENRKQMERENPELAAEFHQLIIIMIGNQLMKASRAMVESLD
jgi:SulP family sulfate permease